MFKTYGVIAAWISGETPMRVRRSILKSLREGEIKVVVNCMVFTEGFDEPSLEAILIARPTRSLVLHCKIIGRGLHRGSMPPERRGDYSGAITALNAEKVILMGQRMDPEKARNFIKENLHAHIASSEEIPITLKSDGNPTIEGALKKAIATFSNSEEGDFRHYLKMILMENQIFLDGNSVRVGHVKFPRYMTERQMNAAMKRITEEIRLYAPNAEVTFAKFPVQHGGREEWKDSEDSA